MIPAVVAEWAKASTKFKKVESEGSGSNPALGRNMKQVYSLPMIL